MPEFLMDNLLTVAECDDALDYATAEKRDLDRKLYNEQFAAEDATDSAETRAKKLATANKKVTMYTDIVAGLDPSDDADERRIQQRALRRATDRRDELADNRSLSPVELLKRALEVAQAQAQLGKTTTFIAEATARKAAILAGG